MGKRGAAPVPPCATFAGLRGLRHSCRMKIGLILSHDGLAGLWTLGCQGGAILAAAELNAAGGVLGEEVEIVHIDSGETAQSAFRAAQRLAIEENVDAVIGLQSSNLRPAVRRGLAGLAPYIYTPHYEGGFCGPGTATLGITDAEVLIPSLDWMFTHRRARRFFFVGNRYIWPRVAHGTTETAIRMIGGEFVGDAFLSLGQRDYDETLLKIARARPDVVVVAMLGEDSVCFNRAFADAGLSRRIIRLNLAFEETQLLGVSDGCSENLFAAQAYFDSSRGHNRDDLAARYESCFSGELPSMTTNSVNCYDAIYLVAALADRIGRVDGHLMARFLRDRLPRAAAYRLIGRSDADAGVRLAEAEGVEFQVRETFMA
ncbi:amino acid/amide ABC transporter substrate-binding protein (HAAT family) [Rhodobacter sp. 140A]|nr:amino acid/amide ABC transporter substrate-binding protein (HAAT family) [Rhodobacter sp. 140A]